MRLSNEEIQKSSLVKPLQIRRCHSKLHATEFNRSLGGCSQIPITIKEAHQDWLAQESDNRPWVVYQKLQ